MRRKNIVVTMLLGACLLSSCQQTTPIEKDPNAVTWETTTDEEGNTYTGQIQNGMPNGYGVMEYATSTIYKGTWANGQWNGECEITWDSGCIYKGEAKDGTMHGIGYMIWPMGDYYYGEWVNGSPNGQGTKYYLVDATAEFPHQQYNIYTGTVVDNLKSGYGVMRYSFGALYDGQWANDVRSGNGIVYWENNPDVPFIKFEGQFANDRIDGEGTLYYKDGRIETGIWKGTEKIG